MKRKLFFWLDKLQISRSERIAVSVLMSLMLLLMSALAFVSPDVSVDDELYAELEEVFRERSEVRQEKKSVIMARYTPADENITTQESVITEQNETNVKIFENSEPAEASMDTTRINVNEANAEELQQLPGIGPAYSQRIVEWRNENGNFTNVDQLLEIRGIGPARLEKIRPMIVL